ncbi:tRNA methyltransferase 2, partial [Physocladia obscura]
AKVEAFTLKNSPNISVSIDDREERHDSRDRPQRSDGRGAAGSKRARENNADDNDARTPQEKINDQVTPLWRQPYLDQLAQKLVRFKNGLGSLKKELLKLINSRDVLEEKKAELEYLRLLGKVSICELQDVVPSPVIDGYRNKCEFTVGFDLDGKPTVGFLLGLFKEGITCVLPPDECLNVSPVAKKVAATFQAFINESKLLPYDRIKQVGFWRLVQVRNQTTGDVMVVVQVNPVGSDAEDRKEAIKLLTERFQEAGYLKTLLVQESSEAHNGFIDNIPCTPLIGEGIVYEELLGLKFRISPTSFFQINTEATKGLYSCVRDWATNSTAVAAGDPENTESVNEATETTAVTATTAPSKNVVLLDLCCGTGTIGLILASKVKKVIGVEMVAEAIKDAEFNARLQKQENVSYICKKVEDAMHEVFKYHVNPGDEVVAVLDPPRAGVHDNVIRAIRGCKGINKIVFVSCDFENALKNFIGLCRPSSKKFEGLPFRPVRAVPYDLFPHSSHCEFVVELNRVSLPKRK